MLVTVIGAGVLGRIYGVALADIGERVFFVVRPERLAETTPFEIERVSGGDRRVLAEPRRVAEAPEDSEVVLVTLRFDEIERLVRTGELVALLGECRAPIVVLTPLLPRLRGALEDLLGRSIVAAMPGAVGYRTDREEVRYWVPIVASTLIDDPATSIAAMASVASERALREALAERLTKAGIPTRLERDVAALNAATTVAFYPLVAAIDIGRGIDAALADKQLVEEVLLAAEECAKLARTLGKLAPWASVLNRFVGPFTLKAGVGLARRLYPASVQFVDAHVGLKLHDQHVAMGKAIVELSRERGIETPALDRLVRRL
jgi:hypothetical protein